MSLRRQVLSGLRWTATAKFVSQLFTWSITIIVIRLLTPADYGLLAMATLFVGLLLLLTEFGIGAAVIQAEEVGVQTLRQVFALTILVDFGLFLFLFLAAPLVAAFFSEPRLIWIVRALALQFIVSIFGVVPASLLTRKLDFKSQSLIDLSGSVVGSLTTLGFAAAGFGVWALVWGNLAITVWRTAGLNLMCPFVHWPDFSVKGTRALLFFGGNVTVARVLWFFYSQADVLVAGKLLGTELLGIYSIAMHFAGLPVRKISSVINQVSFPAFARVQADREKFASHFILATRALSFVAFPVLWGISCTAPELVRVLLGTKWEAAALPMQLLALIMPLYMMAPFMNSAAQGLGRMDIVLKQVLLASIVMPISFLIGSQWGIVGLSLAWVVAFPFVFVGSLIPFLRAINLRIMDVFSAMARPALAALGMYVVVTLAREAISPGTHIVIQLSVLVIIGALIYSALVIAINRDGFREIIGLLKG